MIDPARIIIQKGDITEMVVEAIVNPANINLLGRTSGVDGAIHLAAGAKLMQACIKMGGCRTGEAKLTAGFNLPAGYIIHTVGPEYKDGRHHEAEMLQQCYAKCLEMAVRYEFVSMAFPSLCTGANKYPLEEAAKIAIATISAFAANNPIPQQIYIVCYDDYTHDVYKKFYGENLKIGL